MKHCGNYSIYPEISYNREELKMNRLVETIVHVDYLIFCENLKLTKNEFLDAFINERLRKDYVENYYYLKETGFVFPESINILEFKNNDDDVRPVENPMYNKTYNKCLRPLQTTNFSSDGIQNCTCKAGNY